MSFFLRQRDVEQLRRAQRALLSVPSLDTDPSAEPPHSATITPEAWVEAVAEALRPLFGTDHVYYTEPVGGALPQGGRIENTASVEATFGEGTSSEATSGDAGTALFACHPAVGAAFERGLKRHFTGLEDGFTQFRDAHTTMVRRLVRSAGTGAFHDAPLFDAGSQAASQLYQEVFRPAGIQRKVALSAPLAQGEAMLVVGFAEADAPAFRGRRHSLLELLLPAFESSIRFRRHLARQAIGLEGVLGEAPVPIIFFDARARERFRNEAFHRLSSETSILAPSVPSGSDLREAARALALQVGVEAEVLTAVPAVTEDIGFYRLRACPNVSHQGEAGTLVFVERTDRQPSASQTASASEPDAPSSEAILPSAGDIADITTLTVREAEVARLVAEGNTDQDIADRLEISVFTARRHAGSILKKLDLSSRAGVGLALVRAIQ